MENKLVITQFDKAFNKMLKVNPNKEVSHNVCDFVIENFMDYLPRGKSDTYYDRAYEYFIKNR